MAIATDLQAGKTLLATLPALDGQLPAELRSAALGAAVARAEAAATAAVQAKEAAARAVDEQKAALGALGDLASRIRAAVKGTFGPDSLEYQSVGGTRKSERKAPVRKPRA